MADKTEAQRLAEKILIQKKPANGRLRASDVTAFAEGYKAFLSGQKTEREVIRHIRQEAEKSGFDDLRGVTEVEKGGLYYRLDGNKNLALIRFGGLQRVHAIASHVDSPCLHLKPYPLAESSNLAVLKSHYYGGIKKYQWTNIPLALRGVVHTADGERVDISVGDGEGDPCFTIPDLLPHLAKDQLSKEMRKGVEGEQLNPIVGSDRIEDDNISEQVKLAVAKHLHEEYGLIEEDLVSAELSFVPAGEARDVGFDRSMIAGYGHDDRSSAYTSMRALLEAADADLTQIALFYDKEEIGSYGKTGAQNVFFHSLLEDLIELSESDLRASQVWARTKVLSADVTAALNPNFADVHDASNASYLGYGVAIEKYGGGGGKYSTNDADAEFMHGLLRLFNKEDIPWQTGELGKIDIGGGGTIAMFLARQGADVIDIGIPVLGMHAPTELAHKADLYSAFRAYKSFLENPLEE